MAWKPRKVLEMPLRVLHCVPSLNATDGGPARSVPALADGEAIHGADVRVWSRQAPTISLRAYPSTEFVTGDLRSAVSDRWTPDVVHDHGLWLWSNHDSARFGRHNRIARIVSPRGMLEPWCLRHRRYRKLIAWKLYQHRDLLTSSCLHATSESEVKQFRQLGFEQPVVLLPNGVTLPEEVSGSERHHDKSRGDEREVLFLGRIHPVKGIPHLIEAWHRAVRPGWRLRIVGGDEGGHKNEIRRLIQQKDLDTTVTICDAVHTQEKWKLLRNADLVVLPSHSENFGIVVAEALAIGTPVITTTGTPWKHVLRQRCGWHVEPDARVLEQALREAMQMPPRELQEMGRRGGQWVRQEFAWPDIGKKMLDAYGSLLGGSRQVSWIQPGVQTRRAA